MNQKKSNDTKRKSPKLSKATKDKNAFIGKEIKRILEAGGTKTVTVKKTVYKIDPKEAMKQAVKKAKKFY